MDKAWPLYYYWRCTPCLACCLADWAYCATELACLDEIMDPPSFYLSLGASCHDQGLCRYRKAKFNTVPCRVLNPRLFISIMESMFWGERWLLVISSTFWHFLMNCTRRKWPHCPVISLWLFMAPFIIFSYRNIKVIFAQIYLFLTGKFCIFFHIVHCAGWGHLGLAGRQPNERASEHKNEDVS